MIANVSPEIIFEMPFLILSNVDVDFSGPELQWRMYITKKALLTTRCIELVGKKEFAAAALDPKHKIHIVHVTSLGSTPFDIHPFWKS